MQSGKIISLSVWLMISFNLLLAFGAVWNFQRMSPEIKRVYQRNVVSLEACENMFLALSDENIDTERFRSALKDAEGNITEVGEKETLAQIRAALPALEKGDKQTKRYVANEIKKLSYFNRQAIIKSAEKTQKMRQAGAWGIVFMTFFFLIVAILFEQRLRRSILMPLQELSSVLESYRKGDKFRRCNVSEATSDMKQLFRSVNTLLDKGKK